MLIDNKFIYLSLPRCASTAFFISSIRNNLKIQHAFSDLDKDYNSFDLSKISNMELVYQINHFHETLSSLRDKFGYDHDVISVKRNRHERFISYLNHCIGEFYKNGRIDLYEKFINLSLDDFLFYETKDLINKESKKNIIKEFLNRIGISNYETTLESLLLPIISPLSTYHNNDPNIIWFDFNKLSELEDWVSRKLGKPFILENFGTSNNFKSKIILDDSFINKYNNIYDYYDIVKNQNTII
jgi:hypothetical protein